MSSEAERQREPGGTPAGDLLQPGEVEQEEDRRSVGLVETKMVRLFEGAAKLALECGRSLGPIDVAYETYGELNEARDNAVLIIHALSGDAHAAGRHRAEERKPGWWDRMVGPGKAFDTDRYWVICSNCLGGCMGTTGPSSVDPETGQPYGLRFPMITISDLVEVQRALLDHLGVERLLAAAGGSMAGMQVLDWAIRQPGRVAGAIPIATTARLSAQGIAFDAVGRNAILRDENYQGGMYYTTGRFPGTGLAVARMVGHITYLSEEAMHAKFGRRLQYTDDYRYDFANEFSVETYLDYQGSAFVDRFDANTYLYFSKAMDYFDLARQYGSLGAALARTESRFLVLSYDSDWLFPPAQSREIVNALLEAGKDVTYCNIDCPYGHDSFLLETATGGALIAGFLARTHERERERRGAGAAGSRAARPGGPAERPEPRRAEGHPGSIFSGGRVDHTQIQHLIEPNSSVLDIGCGDGELLELLQRQKNIRGMGITLGEGDVVACTRRGVSVVQYDLHDCLHVFADKSFDYAVLSRTLQVIRRPGAVLRELLRVGKKVVVSFPNFAYWRGRLQLLFGGRVPSGQRLPGAPAGHLGGAAETEHHASIADFERFVREELGARLVQRIPLSSRRGREVRVLPNLRADEVIFVIADA